MKKRKMKMTAALLAAAALLVSGCGAGQTKTDAAVDRQVEASLSAYGQEAANVPEDEQQAANGQEAAGQSEVHGFSLPQGFRGYEPSHHGFPDVCSGLGV